MGQTNLRLTALLLLCVVGGQGSARKITRLNFCFILTERARRHIVYIYMCIHTCKQTCKHTYIHTNPRRKPFAFYVCFIVQLLAAVFRFSTFHFLSRWFIVLFFCAFFFYFFLFIYYFALYLFIKSLQCDCKFMRAPITG